MEREPKLHFNVGGPRGWTTACGIESSSFTDKPSEWDEVDCQRCLKKRPDEYADFRASVIHGLRSQGWSKGDAEAEAADRIDRLRQKEAGQ